MEVATLNHFCKTLVMIVVILSVLSTLTYSEDKETKDGLPQKVQPSTQEQLNELSKKVQELERRLAAVESRVRAIF